MKKCAYAGLVLLVLLSAWPLAAEDPAPAAPTQESQAAPAAPVSSDAASPLQTQQDKVSYAIGLDIGGNFRRRNIAVDFELLVRGMKDAVAGTKPLLTEAELQETLLGFQKELQSKKEEQDKMAGETNRKEGQAFLAENKKKEGVVTLPSGLQYKVLKDGTGPSPKATDNVSCHYKGTLINGTEFDSSYKRGEPATFNLSQVIKGWTEAVPLMKVGAKWQLFIPSDLAYGPRAVSPELGPDSTLIFEIELLEIKPPEAGKK